MPARAPWPKPAKPKHAAWVPAAVRPSRRPELDGRERVSLCRLKATVDFPFPRFRCKGTHRPCPESTGCRTPGSGFSWVLRTTYAPPCWATCGKAIRSSNRARPPGSRSKSATSARAPRASASWWRSWRRSAIRKHSRAGLLAWCAQYDLYSRGESPPWTVMTGTIRLGKGVRREAGSEESRRRNRGFDVQKADIRPSQRWVIRPGTETPDCHSERCRVNPTGPREEDKPYLRRSPLWSVHTGLPREQSRGTGVEKSAEAIVALPGEGLNLLMQGADGRVR